MYIFSAEILDSPIGYDEYWDPSKKITWDLGKEKLGNPEFDPFGW